MPRFTLRDVFWMILVVALCLGWWINSHQLQRQAESNGQRADTLERDVSKLQHNTVGLKKIINGLVEQNDTLRKLERDRKRAAEAEEYIDSETLASKNSSSP